MNKEVTNTYLFVVPFLFYDGPFIPCSAFLVPCSVFIKPLQKISIHVSHFVYSRIISNKK